MASIVKGFQWMTDLVQILAVDRLYSARRHDSHLASTACRSLKFHLHCRIPSLPLDVVIAKLTASAIQAVALPGTTKHFVESDNHAYYHAIAAIVRAVQPKTILEFGTYLGVSSLTMAMNAPA